MLKNLIHQTENVQDRILLIDRSATVNDVIRLELILDKYVNASVDTIRESEIELNKGNETKLYSVLAVEPFMFYGQDERKYLQTFLKEKVDSGLEVIVYTNQFRKVINYDMKLKKGVHYHKYLSKDIHVE